MSSRRNILAGREGPHVSPKYETTIVNTMDKHDFTYLYKIHLLKKMY